ncbi:MAG: ATP-binding protein [Spirochaetia bacterium]|nr:ATP-binding protein [Spirochaetia bacterium]
MKKIETTKNNKNENVSIKYFIAASIPLFFILISLYFILGKIINDIKFTEKEIKGITQIKNINDMTENLQELRGLSTIQSTYSNENISFKIKNEQDNIIKQINSILNYEENTVPIITERLKNINSEILTIFKNKSFERKDIFLAYSQLLREIFAIKRLLANSYNLILDNEPNTFHLVEFSIDIIPSINSEIANIRGISSSFEKNKKEKTNTNFDRNIIQKSQEIIFHEIEKLKIYDDIFKQIFINEYNFSVEEKFYLKKYIDNLQQYIKEIDNLYDNENYIKFDPLIIFEKGTILISYSVAMQEKAYASLEFLLEKRLQNFYLNLFAGLFALFLAVGFMIYFIFIFYSSNKNLIKANKTIFKTNILLNAVLNSIPVQVFWKDKNLVYIGCNEAFAIDTGFKTSNDIIGKTDYDMPWKSEAELYRTDDMNVLKTKKNKINYEEPQTTSAGKTIWLQTSKMPLYDENNNIFGVLGTYFDITARKVSQEKLAEAYEELKKSSEELKEANEELSQYAYVVSHDLKSPLRAIHNYADFLYEDLNDSLEDEQKTYLEGMSKAVNQSEHLVNDLLEFSRIGRKETTIENIDLKIFINEIIDSYNLRKEAEFEISNDLPVIKIEVVLLKQVFQNLILNGIKFNKSSHKKIIIGTTKVNNGSCEIFVKDNGIGIAPKYYTQIFKVFQRLHTQNEFEGTGIGLAIVKKAVEKAGGSIRVESIPNQGSTFFVKLLKNQIRRIEVDENKEVEVMNT